jgi:hypothetical protein
VCVDAQIMPPGRDDPRNDRMRGTAREVGEACVTRPIAESCKFSFAGQGRIQGVTKRRN